MNDTPRSGAHDGVLERTDAGGIIRFERRLPYPIDAVWNAITDPDRLADWWLPFDADISVDLRPGGTMVFAGRDDGMPTMTFEVLRVEPPTLLEHTHADPGSLLRWELESIDTGCVLRLSHFVTDPDIAVDNRYVVGLHTSLARLAPCLDGRPVEWDWEAFAEAQAAYAEVGIAPPVQAS